MAARVKGQPWSEGDEPATTLSDLNGLDDDVSNAVGYGTKPSDLDDPQRRQDHKKERLMWLITIEGVVVVGASVSG